MGDLRYIDFDVAIEPAGNGFTARVFNSPVGQAASTFRVLCAPRNSIASSTGKRVISLPSRRKIFSLASIQTPFWPSGNGLNPKENNLP